MITNAHSKCLYPDALSVLGTLGVPGNALFFLVSGFTLGLGAKQMRFIPWYKRRISRIWPSVIVWVGFLALLFFGSEITTEKLWLADDFWFVKCIAIYYIFYYFAQKYFKHWLWIFIIVGGLFPISAFVMCDHIEGSVFESLKYVSHFGIMMIGAWGASIKDRLNGGWLDAVLAVFWFVLFYALQIRGKGCEGWLYYLQISAILPLMLMAYHSMKWALACKCDFMTKQWALPLRVIGSLTLEIYLVNIAMITTVFNKLFPLNLLIVFGL